MLVTVPSCPISTLKIWKFLFFILSWLDRSPASDALGFKNTNNKHLQSTTFSNKIHACYFQDRRERLKHALTSIAWPMAQAGISTILSLCVLGIIQAYMVKVFVKVVVLVVMLGLIHGLIILPVVFGAIPLQKKVADIDFTISSPQKVWFFNFYEWKIRF